MPEIWLPVLKHTTATWTGDDFGSVVFGASMRLANCRDTEASSDVAGADNTKNESAENSI
jgi:hypothetical protein